MTPDFKERFARLDEYEFQIVFNRITSAVIHDPDPENALRVAKRIEPEFDWDEFASFERERYQNLMARKASA